MTEETEMREFLQAAVEVARAAGEIQRRNLGGDIRIGFKGEVDLVTEVDQKCEELIVGALRERFPRHDFLAEEGEYPASGAEFRWVIDPLDGTTNYAHGYPWFSVSIALERAGEVVVGVVYHPLMDEMFTAVKGEGAWLNGRRIRVSDRAVLKECLLATGFPYDRDAGNENNFRHFINFQLAARGVRRAGSAALDLASVAAGRLDGYWELKLKPWDVAAGMLLVTEAGGRVTDHGGAPFSIHDHRILASNGAIHGAMVEVLGRPGDTDFPCHFSTKPVR